MLLVKLAAMSRTRDDSRRDNDDDTSPTRTGTQAVVQKDEPTLVGGGGKASDKPGRQLLASPAIACTTTADKDQDDGDADDGSSVSADTIKAWAKANAKKHGVKGGKKPCYFWFENTPGKCKFGKNCLHHHLK